MTLVLIRPTRPTRPTHPTPPPGIRHGAAAACRPGERGGLLVEALVSLMLVMLCWLAVLQIDLQSRSTRQAAAALHGRLAVLGAQVEAAHPVLAVEPWAVAPGREDAARTEAAQAQGIPLIGQALDARSGQVTWVVEHRAWDRSGVGRSWPGSSAAGLTGPNPAAATAAPAVATALEDLTWRAGSPAMAAPAGGRVETIVFALRWPLPIDLWDLAHHALDQRQAHQRERRLAGAGAGETGDGPIDDAGVDDLPTEDAASPATPGTPTGRPPRASPDGRGGPDDRFIAGDVGIDPDPGLSAGTGERLAALVPPRPAAAARFDRALRAARQAGSSTRLAAGWQGQSGALWVDPSVLRDPQRRAALQDWVAGVANRSEETRDDAAVGASGDRICDIQPASSLASHLIWRCLGSSGAAEVFMLPTVGLSAAFVLCRFELQSPTTPRGRPAAPAPRVHAWIGSAGQSCPASSQRV